VPFNTTDGSAVAGTDYNAAAGTVTFNPGQTVQFINVGVITNTTVNAPNRTFNVVLGTPTGNASLAPVPYRTGVGTIVDDDGGGSIILTVGDVSFTEGLLQSTINFTVFSNGNPGQDVPFNFTTQNGTASAGIDYTATSGTRTIANGTSSVNIS